MSDVEKNTGTHKPEFDGEWVRLGDVCEIVNGATPRTGVPEYWGGDIKWVTPAELRNEIHTVFDTAKHLTTAGFESASLRMMPAGTILLTTRAPIGKLALAGDEMCCNQGFKCLICPETVNNEWLCRLLKHRVPELQAMGTGATFKELSKRAISDYRICVPPMETQIDIVKKLTKLDEVLANCRTLLSALDDLVKSQFVEMFGGDRNPVIRASEVLTNFRNGVSPSKMGKVHSDVLTLSSITRGRFDAAARKDGTFEEMPQADKRVSSRDFYICRGNGNKKLVGVAAFAEEDHPDLVFPDTMIAATVNDSMVCQSYLAYEWSQPNARRQIESKARTTNGTFKINQKTIAGVQIPLPPLEEQIKFANFVARVDKLAFDVQQQIEKLETLKQSLMQEYFG